MFKRFWQSLAVSRNVLIMGLTTGGFVLVIQTWQRLIPLQLKHLGATDLTVSVIFGVLAVASGLAQYPGGLLADRLGRKPLIVWPTVAAGLLYGWAAFAQHWLLLTLPLALVNLGSSFQSASFNAIMAESVPLERRGSAFGSFWFFLSVSFAAGPALGALLLPYSSFGGLMFATAVAALLAAAVRQGWLQETRGQAASGPPFHLRQLLEGDLLLLLLAGCLFVAAYGLTIMGPFMTLYTAEVQGLNEQQILTLSAVGGTTAVLASYLGGFASRRWGSRLTLAVGIFSHVGTTLMWTGQQRYLPVLLWYALSFSTLQVALVAYDTLKTEIASRSSAGAVLGALGTATTASAGLMPPLAGLMLQRFGVAAPYWLATALGGLAVLCTLGIGRRAA